MSFEEDKIEHELSQLRNQNLILSNSEYSKFVLNPEFKDQFTIIPESVCAECGQIYRITHKCDSSEVDEWLPGWEKMIRTLFESHNKQEKLLEETQKQEEHLQKLQEESRLKIELAKQRLKNEQLQKELELAKQGNKNSYDTASYTKQKYSPSSYRGKKLALDSITQLNMTERTVYEELRQWRNSQARREHTKPYIIAHNTMLMAIVYYRISSGNELERISGFSERKAEKFGPAIIGIMKNNGMATGIVRAPAKKLSTKPKKLYVKKKQKIESKKGIKFTRILPSIVIIVVIVIFFILISL